MKEGYEHQIFINGSKEGDDNLDGNNQKMEMNDIIAKKNWKKKMNVTMANKLEDF